MRARVGCLVVAAAPPVTEDDGEAGGIEVFAMIALDH